ncbi:MAG: thiosulfate sulfurtransferase GlpE [Nitrospiria bacterium]
MNFNRVSVEETRELMSKGEVTILDIRDEQSYTEGHLPDAMHIKGINIDDFVAHQDKEKPLLIYCYHGHSSMPAAAYFADRGFNRTYSMDGGYEAWRVSIPGSAER